MLNAQQLADIIFGREGVGGDVVDIRMMNAELPRDIFWGCLDLLSRGLVILFGRTDPSGCSSSIALDDLTMDQFQLVAARLRSVGIHVHLEPVPTHRLPSHAPSNLGRLARMCHNNPDTPLHDLRLLLRLASGQTFAITFEIRRPSHASRPCGAALVGGRGPRGL